MHGTESTNVARSNSAPATFRQRWQHLAEPLWFAVMCRELWGVNAPKELGFVLTDRWSERTYRGWSSGDNEPPASALAALIASEHGFRIVAWIVRDTFAGWWRNMQRALRIAAQIDKLDLQ
jgi:hypothetical protein